MCLLVFFTNKKSICIQDTTFSHKSPSFSHNVSSGESSQIIPTRQSEGWNFSLWNHLLVLLFGQLLGCGSLRELIDIITAYDNRAYNLGFVATPVVQDTLSMAKMIQEPRIFEEFAFYMVLLTQHRGIAKEFELQGRFYAVVSTTNYLCMSVFRWLFSEVQNRASKYIHRSVSSLKSPYSTESPTPKSATTRLSLGLTTNPTPAIYSTVVFRPRKALQNTYLRSILCHSGERETTVRGR